MRKQLLQPLFYSALSFGMCGASFATNIAVVAHRGGSALAPENTLGAFRNAITLGVDMVECDVHLSNDGQVVVMHDADVSRTTDGTGVISDKTLVELKTLNAAAKFGDGKRVERIPTLEEVLDAVKGKARVQIEIKSGPHGRYVGLEQKVVDLLKAKHMTADVIIISFDMAAIKEIKHLDSTIQTGALFGGGWEKKDQGQFFDDLVNNVHADYFLPYFAPVTDATVEAVHAHGMKIGVWTVNSTADMRRLATIGLDAMTTDKPDELKKVLGK